MKRCPSPDRLGIACLIVMVGTCVSSLPAANPLVADVGMTDPHVRIYNDAVYLYAGRDADPNLTSGFNMPDWRVWRSTDLIHWTEVDTISPSDNYMPNTSTDCWAGDAHERNGYYYFYFSNFTKDTGVMRATAPDGPFQDILGAPLVPASLTPTKEFDPTVFIDNDGNQTPYIIFGQKDGLYHIAVLNNDMMSLAEAPQSIAIDNSAEWNSAPAYMDKNYLHKHDGIYYLSWGNAYATSSNIYGPYTGRGVVGTGYGLGVPAHGSFFEWKGQWYHVWTDFVVQGFRYRECYMTYVHYKDNGDLVTDTAYLDAHFAEGVGEYSASWQPIEAEWYFEASGTEKRESPNGGFEIQYIHNGDYLRYPNVKDVPHDGSIDFTLSSNFTTDGVIEVRDGGLGGPLLGSVTIPNTGGWANYQTVTCELTNAAGTKDLYFVFTSSSASGLMNLDKFEFSGSTLGSQGPFNGPHSVPGRVEAEDFDSGGAGVGYVDNLGSGYNGTESGPNVVYRPDETVDLENSLNGESGSLNVGYVEAGEWIEHTLEVGNGGTYEIAFRVANGSASNASLTASIDGTVIDTLVVPPTGGWQSWQTLALGNLVSLGTGTSVLRTSFQSSGLNLGWIEFAAVPTGGGLDAAWGFDGNVNDSSGNGRSAGLNGGPGFSNDRVVGSKSLSLSGSGQSATVQGYKGVPVRAAVPSAPGSRRAAPVASSPGGPISPARNGPSGCRTPMARPEPFVPKSTGATWWARRPCGITRGTTSRWSLRTTVLQK